MLSHFFLLPISLLCTELLEYASTSPLSYGNLTGDICLSVYRDLLHNSNILSNIVWAKHYSQYSDIWLTTADSEWVKFKFGSLWALWGESGVIIILSASPHGFNNSYFGFLLQASIITGDLSYCVVQNFLQGSVFSPTKYPKIPFLYPSTSDLFLLILLLSRAFRSVPAGGARYYAD